MLLYVLVCRLLKYALAGTAWYAHSSVANLFRIAMQERIRTVVLGRPYIGATRVPRASAAEDLPYILTKMINRSADPSGQGVLNILPLFVHQYRSHIQEHISNLYTYRYIYKYIS